MAPVPPAATMTVQGALVCVYAALSLCSAAAAAVPALSFVAAHGKRSKHRNNDRSNDRSIDRSSDRSTDRGVMGLVAGLQVPKKWFTLFYAAGAPWTLLCLGYVCAYADHDDDGDGDDGGRRRGAVALVMLTAHLLRRLYECFFCTSFGASTMHLSGFLVGMLHYFLAPLCFVSVRKEAHPRDRATLLLAVLLFVAANVLQHKAHRHLFQLKMRAQSLPPSQKYSLPTEGLFRWVACPHYFAEILIYGSLCLVSPWPNWAAVGLVMWVASNLTVVAHQQMKWYKHTFAHVPKDWKVLVPFVF